MREKEVSGIMPQFLPLDIHSFIYSISQPILINCSVAGMLLAGVQQ